MRFTAIVLGALTLILLVMIPVGGAPASLRKGSQASYHLSVSISFAPPVCPPNPTIIAQSAIICPIIVALPSTVSITGTLGWLATNKSSTRVNLNVTRDLTISRDDGTAMPVFHSVGSFNESIDLATRIVSIMPFLMPEMDQALQMAQSSMATSLPSGMTWSSTMNTIEPSLAVRPLRTMWWVNGPLEANQTVQVLVFPTNVTGLRSIDLGSLGTRQAWALVFKPSLAVPQPMVTGTSTMIRVNNVQAVFTFNYDKTSDLLLSASADIDMGFMSTVQVQCDPSSGICPAASMPTIVDSGLNIHASLTLASITNLSLDQPLGPSSTSSGGTTGSGSGSGTGTGSGSGTGSNSGSSPQPTVPASSGRVQAWIYWALGVAAVAIIASGLWIRRGRKKRNPSRTPPIQPIS